MVFKVIIIPILFLVNSCGSPFPFTLDPAEKLGQRIRREANTLKKSGDSKREFKYVPGKNIATGPELPEGMSSVHFLVRELDQNGDSLLQVSDQSYTSYHSNFVNVYCSIYKTKKIGEEYLIVLTKESDGEVFLSVR